MGSMTMPRILGGAEHVWRLFAVGSGFLLFGIGGALMSLTIIPMIMLTVRDSSARVATTRKFVHGSFWITIRYLIFVRVIDLEVQGAKEFRRSESVIFVANHPSLLDVVLIMSLMSDAQCVVKSKLWRNPYMGIVIRAAGYIRNDGDPEKLVEDCVAALRTGQNLIIFPEGSRTAPGDRPKFRRGFAHIALRAEANIVPIAIRCTPAFLTKGNPWFAIPETRALFQFYFYHQLGVRKYVDHLGTAIAARRLSRDVDQIIAEELGYG